MQELLSPKNDFVFKRIFGSKGNEEITKDLLNSILETKVDKVELDYNPVLESNIFDEKIGILDVKAKLNDNTNCDIEMQIIDKRNTEKRILYYWSKMYSRSLKKGRDYENLEKSIVVIFVDYELKKLKDIPKALTIWNIREKDFSQKVLTNDLELYIIEIPKFEKCEKQDKNLNKWIKFIERSEVWDMNEEDSKALEEAWKILEDLSQSEKDRYIAELREKYILDKYAIEGAGYDKGLEAGIKQGIEDGLKKGMEDGLKRGMEDGLKKGMKDGLKRGMEDGLKQGIEERRKERKNKNSQGSVKNEYFSGRYREINRIKCSRN